MTAQLISYLDYLLVDVIREQGNPIFMSLYTNDLLRYFLFFNSNYHLFTFGPLSDKSYGFEGNLIDVDVSFLVKIQSPKSDSRIIEI